MKENSDPVCHPGLSVFLPIFACAPICQARCTNVLCLQTGTCMGKHWRARSCGQEIRCCTEAARRDGDEWSLAPLPEHKLPSCTPWHQKAQITKLKKTQKGGQCCRTSFRPVSPAGWTTLPCWCCHGVWQAPMPTMKVVIDCITSKVMWLAWMWNESHHVLTSSHLRIPAFPRLRKDTQRNRKAISL